MTKIQLQYALIRPLSDADAHAVSNAHAYYGIQRIQVDPSLKAIAVEYDASRLSEKDVEHALLQYGVPIERKWALD